MLFSMYVPNLFYLWASITKPSFEAVYGIVFVDQFGYGFGFSAYMVFMMFIAQGSKFKTAHYAISTALMATGATIAGSLSGYLQTFFLNYLGASLGYSGFFATTFALCIPGLMLLKSLPLEGEDLYTAPDSVG
jgi:PAT family beta-lactamase induction signal transducer AmpG